MKEFFRNIAATVNPLMDRLAEEVGSRPRVAAWIIFVSGLYIIGSFLKALLS